MFNPWWPDYAQEINSAKRWTRERWTFFYKHLANYFRLQQPVNLTIDKDRDNNRTLVVNNIALKNNEFNGKFFPGRKLTVKTLSDTDGLYVHGWKVSVTDATGVTTTEYMTETLDIDMPKGTKVEINSILSTEPASVTAISDGENRQDITIYDISGCNVGNSMTTLIPGIYIVRKGNSASKIIVK